MAGRVPLGVVAPVSSGWAEYDFLTAFPLAVVDRGFRHGVGVGANGAAVLLIAHVGKGHELLLFACFEQKRTTRGESENTVSSIVSGAFRDHADTVGVVESKRDSAAVLRSVVKNVGLRALEDC